MRIRSLIILAVLIAVLIGYYWQNKPFDSTAIQALTGIILDLIPVSVLAICGGSAGRWLFARFALNLDGRAERITVETLFGLGIIATYASLVGLLGAFKSQILWLPTMALGSIALIATRGSWLLDCYKLIKGAFHTTNLWARALTYSSVILLGTGLILALSPQTAWDALTYGLVVPARYLAQGHISWQPNQPLFGYTQNIEMLYGLAMSLFGRDTAAAPIHWLYGLLALSGAAGVVLHRTGSDSMARLAFLIPLTAIGIWQLLGWAKNDLAMMAYGAAILIILMQWRETRRDNWLALLGLLLGMALGTKLPAGALVISAGLFIMVYTVRSGFRLMLRSELIIAGATLVTFAPWLLKGALLYHNAIYPNIFGGVDWNSVRGAQYFGQGLLNSGQVWAWLLLPFSATVYGTQFLSSFDFPTGPWLLTLPFLLVISWRTIRNTAHEYQLLIDSTLFVVPLLIYWWILAGISAIGVQTRLMTMAMPAFAVLSSLAIISIRRLPVKPFNVFFLFQALFVVSVGFELLQATQFVVQSNAVSYLIGTIKRDDFLIGVQGFYEDAMNHLKDLPNGTTVRFLWEARGYYCPPTIQCLADTMFDNWQSGLLTKSSDDLLTDWGREGNAYFLVYNTAFDSMGTRSTTAQAYLQFADTRRRWLTPVWSNGDYTLYTWKTF